MRNGSLIQIQAPCHCAATELCGTHWAVLHLVPDVRAGRSIGRQGLAALSRVLGQDFADEAAAQAWIKEHL